MKIAIIGFAGQGTSSFEYWNTPDNTITICDMSTDIAIPEGIQSQLGPDYLANLDQFDLIIRTPKLHPRDIAAANPETLDILEKVTSNTNEFFKVCPTKNIIGVTGTKGKGTTSTLITKMLEAAGKRVHLGGNIGIPPLELLKNDIQPDDWVVLELANFQLIDLKYSPKIAVCLMVEPEHLDWHEDMEEYIAAKQQLFIHQNSDDIAIYYGQNENSESIADASEGMQIPYFAAPGAEVVNDRLVIGGHVICPVSDFSLRGKHNWQNICAATTATAQITEDFDAIKTAIQAFLGLPYRIELRKTIAGVNYYNDSFATAPGATVAALDAITEPKVMILGGYDRGLDLSELVKAVVERSSQIRKLVIIGQSGERLISALKASGYDNFVQTKGTMLDIVASAAAEAQPGDAVVLSPAFASFDMFKNFEDRGNKFNEAVESL